LPHASFSRFNPLSFGPAQTLISLQLWKALLIYRLPETSSSLALTFSAKVAILSYELSYFLIVFLSESEDETLYLVKNAFVFSIDAICYVDLDAKVG